MAKIEDIKISKRDVEISKNPKSYIRTGMFSSVIGHIIIIFFINFFIQ